MIVRRQGSGTAGPLRAEGEPGSQACAQSCCPSSSCCLFLLELTHPPSPVSSPLPHLPGVNSERPSCRRQYLGSPLRPPPSVLYHPRRCRNRCLSPLLSWMTFSSERAQGPAEPLSRTQVLRAVPPVAPQRVSLGDTDTTPESHRARILWGSSCPQPANGRFIHSARRSPCPSQTLRSQGGGPPVRSHTATKSGLSLPGLLASSC